MASKWIVQVFRSKIAKRGGVARRKMASIKKHAGMDEFRAECKRRGYHIVQHRHQWLIFCDKAKLKIIL